MKRLVLSTILLFLFIFSSYLLMAEDAPLEVYTPKIVIDALLTGDEQLGAQPGNFYIDIELNSDTKPSDIDFDSEGNIYIFDPGNNRIQEFDKEGKYVRSIPVKDCYKWNDEDKTVHYKREFKIDKDNNIFVLDNAAKEIIKIDNNGNELESISLIPISQNYPALFIGELAIDENGNPYFEDIYYDKTMRKSKVKNIIKIKQGKVEVESVSTKSNLGVMTDNRGRKYELDKIGDNEININRINDNKIIRKFNIKVNGNRLAARIFGEDKKGNIYFYVSCKDYLGALKYNKEGVLVARIIDIREYWYKENNILPIKQSVAASLFIDQSSNFYIARLLPDKNRFQVIRWSKQ